MNKITKNIAALIAFGIGTTTISFAQVTQQKIGNNPTIINPNAALQVDSTTKGLLLPRLGLTATNSFAPLAAHVAGMTVYNTATVGTGLTAVTPGYYYNDGSQWVRVATGGDAKTEPWRQQTTTNEATANSQSIYQTGSVAVGDFSGAASTKKMEVKGDFKSEITAGGGVVGTEVGSPLNPTGAMHYWSNGTNYRIASANHVSSALTAITGTTTNTFAATSTNSEMSSVNGTNSLSTVRAENTGNFFMESYNVTTNFGSTFSLQNDGLRMRHTNTGGATNPFPLNNDSEIFLQKANGVRFSFKDSDGLNPQAYWFPTTTGNAGQVLTQSGTGGKIEWRNPSTLFTEVDGVIGNEVSNATTNGGLTRAGAGTTASPYTLGLTAGSATGNVMTWNGTAWNPAAPVNIYNADGLLTGSGTSRTLTLNSKTLNFDGTDRRTYWDPEGRIHQRATNTSLDAAMGFHNSGANLWIQQWSAGSAITASNNSTELSLGTHFTQVAAPIIFNTSPGGNTTGVERMRITGTGKIGMGTFTPSEQLDNTGITRLRNLPLNGATNAINTTATGDESASQDQTFTATRTVVADANGVLGTVAGLPANPVNIYNANGTLTADRTVNMDSKDLTFSTAGNGNISFYTNNAGMASQNIIGTTTRGNLTLTGGSATVDLYVDNGGVAQLTSRGNSTGLNVGTTTGQMKPLNLVTNGLIRATVTPTGEMAIGATTIPNVMSGVTVLSTPKFHVVGDVSITGKYYTTNSVYADYVFEKYFKGSSDINPNYEFKSLNYVKDFIKANHHLPGVESIDDLAKAENGYTFDMTKLTVQSLEKIEELYIHTIEQQDKIEQQQVEINQLKNDAEQTKQRLERLEKMFGNK